jgi:hypothetical protein
MPEAFPCVTNITDPEDHSFSKFHGRMTLIC